jgi:hypothetical protein
MFESLISTRMVLATGIATLFVAAAAPHAGATNLNPSGTVNPLPGAFLPSGATQEYTTSVSFDLNLGGLPFPNHMRGTITQYVYRLADNTITFGYYLQNASNSNDGITDFYVRDFADYTTDVFQSIPFIGTFYEADLATRSFDGSAVDFQWTVSLPVASNSRVLYVKTNATAYGGTNPRGFFLTSGRATVCTGSNCLNVYGLAYPVQDSSPPVVSIAAPAALSCVCDPAPITGTAYDPNGFDSYDLEYSASPNGPWTLISSSSTAVASTGTLGMWSTTSVAQGYYFLRLTATNSTGLTSAVTSVVFVDKQFDQVDVRSPATGQILGGTVCFDGTVQDGNQSTCFNNYVVQYAPLPAGTPFLPVDPANPIYTTPVINDGLGAWNTRTGGAAVADGAYRVRIIGTDDCGHTRTATRDITIDNTAPIGVISSPGACARVGHGVVPITGIVSDAHLAGWSLQYTGGDSHGWVTIASGNSAVNGVLANWNTAGLRPCGYVVRLLVADASGVNCGSTTNQAEYTTAVIVGCPGDFNGSGAVEVQDIFDFLNAWFGPC